MSWIITPVCAIFLPRLSLEIAFVEEGVTLVIITAPISWRKSAIMSQTTKMGVMKRGGIQRSFVVLSFLGTTRKTIRAKTM